MSTSLTMQNAATPSGVAPSRLDIGADSTLNTGFGHCRPEATTKVVAPISWVSEGREMQFAATVLAAVHDHNRHAADGELVALDFPTASFRREVAGRPGVVARLIGSRTALESIRASDRLAQFNKRRVSRPGRPAKDPITDLEPLAEGYCLVRSRKSDRVQPGELRRRLARAARTGRSHPGYVADMKARLATLEDLDIAQRRALAAVGPESAVLLGQMLFTFTRRKSKTPNPEMALVSTWGMSSPDAPVIFGAWIADEQLLKNGAEREVGENTPAGVVASLFAEETA